MLSKYFCLNPLLYQIDTEGLQVARCDVESPTQRFQFQYNSPV